MEEVAKIIDDAAATDSEGERYNKYKVVWKQGRGSEWVAEADCDCPNVIFAYEKAKKMWTEPCEVEGIVESIENSAGEVEYLVKWKDTDEWENSFSWAKESDFVETELLEQFKTDPNYHFDHGQPVLEKILSVVRKPYDKYQVKFENMPPSRASISVDKIYVFPGGRRAIRRFYRDNEKKFPNDPYQLI